MCTHIDLAVALVTNLLRRAAVFEGFDFLTGRIVNAHLVPTWFGRANEVQDIFFRELTRCGDGNCHTRFTA